LYHHTGDTFTFTCGIARKYPSGQEMRGEEREALGYRYGGVEGGWGGWAKYIISPKSNDIFFHWHQRKLYRI